MNETKTPWQVALIGGRHRARWQSVARLEADYCEIAEVNHLGVCLIRPIDFGRAGIFHERYDWRSVDPEQRFAVAEYARLERPSPLYPIGHAVDPLRIPG